MEFIESSIFTKYLYEYLSDDEYMGLQNYLIKFPETGNIVQGSGGVRKMRWGMSNSGKSGGVRIIYFFKKQDGEIWLLTIYSKNEIENIPSHILKKIKEEFQNAES
jgi:hypothetical protein